MRSLRAILSRPSGTPAALFLVLVLTCLLACGHACDRPPFDPAHMARLDLAVYQCVTECYAADEEGAFPATLRELFLRDADGASYLEGGELDERGDPIDPWGRRYGYLTTGPDRRNACLWTLGADGEYGGRGEDEDAFRFYSLQRRSLR